MSTVFYKITRETSKYNKRMKWHIVFTTKDGSVFSSDWEPTQKEAIATVELAKWNGKRGFPIGDRIFYTDYEELPE